nr:DedA family protein [Candidatus Cloacimonadota bacterium]
YWVGKPLIPKLEKSKNRRRALRYISKYGSWSLLLSWTPFLGDPLTIAAGIFRENFLKFSLIVYSLRIIGYAVIAWFFV